MKKPLEGIRMLDLTHMLSGPYGAMIISDLGADTVKVEPPKTGEGRHEQEKYLLRTHTSTVRFALC